MRDLWIKTNPPKHGAGQWLASIVVSFCFCSAGMGFAWTSPAFSKIKEGEVDFKLDHYEMSMIAVLGCAGRILSPLPISYAMDIIGRKGCFIAVRVLQTAHWLIIYCFHNFWALCLARLATGLYAGATIFVIPIYIGEATHKSIRGQVQSFLSVQFILGAVIESAIGAFLSYDNLAIASAGFDFFSFLFMFMIPESPYFQIMKEDMQGAKLSLQWLRGEQDIQEELGLIEKNMKIQLARSSKYVDLFKVKSIRKALTCVLILMLLQRLCGVSCLIPYGSFVFPDTWYLSSNKGSIVLNCTYLIMCASSGFFIDSLGRKMLLFFSTAGACFFLTCCAIWFFLRDKMYMDVEGTEWLVIIFLIAQAAFYSTGYFYIPLLIMAEMFPMNMKAKANALCSTIGVTVGCVVIVIFLPLTNNYGLYTNFIIYSLAAFFGAIYSTTIVETKRKSLEQIQAILEGQRDSSSLASSQDE
ncbi:unnamed protein product [Nezara viridula]|uniref:Major facilitator superfamily (MFS) profile domain-containing protein n=1 Tax=Nezara viridula TaxID=85310 RepID=A0A9P0MV94_NEZVI|nr:unnamed protein product [Nezara viridula]